MCIVHRACRHACHCRPSAQAPRPHLPCHQAHGGEPIIPFSGAYEAKIFDMSEEEKEEYNKEQGEGAA